MCSVVRRAAGLLDKASPQLVDAVTDVMLHQKQLGIGRAYARKATLQRPAGRETIIDMIRRFAGSDERERILTQEIMLILGSLITRRPELFDGMLTLRVGHLLLLITTHLGRKRRLPQEQTFDQLLELPPHQVAELVEVVLEHYQESENALLGLEALHVSDQGGGIKRVTFAEERATAPTAAEPVTN